MKVGELVRCIWRFLFVSEQIVLELESLKCPRLRAERNSEFVRAVLIEGPVETGIPAQRCALKSKTRLYPTGLPPIGAG